MWLIGLKLPTLLLLLYQPEFVSRKLASKAETSKKKQRRKEAWDKNPQYVEHKSLKKPGQYLQDVRTCNLHSILNVSEHLDLEEIFQWIECKEVENLSFKDINVDQLSDVLGNYANDFFGLRVIQ